ncbi:MAG: serine/threonine-protein kinase [bacterium]|nr:serine/threonine-protein kinase [bacterium]
MLAEGTILQDRYRVLKLQDEGGTATVYLAARLGMDEEVRLAVKQLKPESLAPQEFLNEVRLLFRLNHPNLPKVYDFFQENGEYFLVTDFVDGETLSSLVRERGAVNEDEAADYALQVCDIFRYLHEGPDRIIHRDLKPSNLMVDRSGQLKLIDFGIAMRRGSRGTAVHGFTESFASPEQRLNLLTDERSDIYSFGATLYYLLRGNPPDQEFLHALGRSRRRVVSRELERIVKTCLEADPDRRYQSFAEVADDLQAYRVARRTSMGRRLRLAAAVVAVAAVVLGGRALLDPRAFTVFGDEYALAGSKVVLHLALPPSRLAAEEELKWFIYDRQVPGEPVATFQGRAAVTFEPQVPGVYAVEVRDGERRISERKEIAVYQNVAAPGEVLLAQTLRLTASPALPEIPGRSHEWQWELADGRGGVTERTTGQPWLDYVFPEAGVYAVRLAVLVRVAGSFDLLVRPPPELKTEIRVAQYLVAQPERIIYKSSFEEEARGWPAEWTLVGRAAYEREMGFHGLRSVRLAGAQDERSYAITTLALREGRRYRITVWVKGSEVAPGGRQILEAQFRSMVDDSYVLPGQRIVQQWSGDFEWSQMSLDFKLPPGLDTNLEIYLKAVGPGTVWFDSCVVEVLDG